MRPADEASRRVLFANHLRGLAALCVACSHLIGVYWAMPGIAAAATFTPVQPGPPPPLFALVADPRLQLGPFGVATFFLISGFVIPFSLHRQRRRGFLLARALRVYPTYVAAQLLQMLVLYGNARFWHQAFGYSAWSIAANCLLIENYVGVPSTDLVNWTLGVELKFYLLAALLAPLLRRGSLPALFAVALASLGLNEFIAMIASGRFASVHPGLLTAASYDSLYVPFLMLGTLFHFRWQGTVGRARFAAALLALTALFLLCWHISRIAAQFPLVPMNYLYALALFAALYALRAHVPPSRVLAGLAAISYPFYLLHVLIGFSLLKLLLLAGSVPYPASLALTLVAIALLAFLLHRAVELPTTRLGRQVARRLGTPGTLPDSASFNIS